MVSQVELVVLLLVIGASVVILATAVLVVRPTVLFPMSKNGRRQTGCIALPKLTVSGTGNMRVGKGEFRRTALHPAQSPRLYVGLLRLLPGFPVAERRC